MKSAKSRAVPDSVPSGVFLKDIPDVLLPSQFFEFVGARMLSSEQRLMLAVLIDAINVLGVSPNRRKSNSFNDASSWVFAKDVKSPLSFDHVCDSLSLNAERLRGRLSDLLSEHIGTLIRLRVKAGGRMQRVTINRTRGRFSH